MKNNLAKLINVKSILTIVLTFVFAHMCITGRVESDAFLDVFKMIVIFYFGTQAAKNQSDGEKPQ